mmetsp:Transcript_8178/g.12552  ORF Transcript_8178/g.12552 Transcript_8178/m.12552 type:complete len:374 (-) Transcript_8178:2934-4055(-)
MADSSIRSRRAIKNTRTSQTQLSTMDTKDLKSLSSPSKSTSRVQELTYLAFNFFSTIAVTFINKACFSRVNFQYPAMLCNIHFIVTWIGVELMRKCGLFEPLKDLKESSKGKHRIWERNFFTIVLVVGLVTPLNNTSLKLNGMGFYQIFKLLVTPGVVFLEYILDGKILSRNRTLSLVAVCFFVLISSRAELQFSLFGTVCASLWVPLAATYKVQWGRVRKLYQCSTLALMHAVLPYATIVQFIISPLVDPPGFFQFQWTPESIFWIGLSGVAAFLVNFSGFLVIGNIGALAHVLLGQCKMALIMVGAYLLFNDRYSSPQLWGAAGAVFAIVIYTVVTVREQKFGNVVSGSSRQEVLPVLHNTSDDPESITKN